MAGGSMFGAAVGMISSVMKLNDARKMRKKAQRLIDNFEPQPLSNKFTDLEISTVGAEIRRDSAERSFAGITEAARGGGMRGILGVTGVAQSKKEEEIRKIGVGLDKQRVNNLQLEATDEVRIEGILNKRKEDEIAGYGKMLDVAMDKESQAWADVTSSVGSMGSSMGGGAGGGMGGAGGGMSGNMGQAGNSVGAGFSGQ